MGGIVGPGAAIAARSILRSVPLPQSVPRGVVFLFVVVATVAAFAALVAWLLRKVTQREFRRYLCNHHIPVCLWCAYDLRGQTEARCPECGRPFDPTLLKDARPQAPP